MSEKKSYKYKTVMLVDDNDIDNFVNRKTIEAIGFAEKIEAHINPETALEFLQMLEKGGEQMKKDAPQIIFLDINMPLMDGFEFVKKFEKLNEATKKNIRIILLSSSMNPADREHAKEFKSIHSFVSKPLSREQLQKI